MSEIDEIRAVDRLRRYIEPQKAPDPLITAFSETLTGKQRSMLAELIARQEEGIRGRVANISRNISASRGATR